MEHGAHHGSSGKSGVCPTVCMKRLIFVFRKATAGDCSDCQTVWVHCLQSYAIPFAVLTVSRCMHVDNVVRPSGDDEDRFSHPGVVWAGSVRV